MRNAIRQLPIVIFILTCLLYAAPSRALEPLTLDPSFDSQRLGDHLEILLDESGLLTLESVTGPEYSAKFNPLQTTNLGSEGQPLWLRFTVVNRSAQAVSVAASFDSQVLEYLTFFVPDGRGGYLKTERGLAAASNADAPLIPGASCTIELDPGQEKTVYVRMHTQSTALLGMTMRSQTEQDRFNLLAVIFLGLNLGIMGALIFFHLLLTIRFREMVPLHFSLFAASFLFYLLAASGWGARYLWGGWHWFSLSAHYIFGNLGVITGVAFSRSFLETKQRLVWADKLLILIMTLAGLSFLSTFIDAGLANMLTGLVSLIALASLLFVAILSWRSGNKTALPFLASWSIFVMAGAAFALVAVGVLETGVLVLYGLPTTFCIGGLLLAMTIRAKMTMIDRHTQLELHAAVEEKSNLLEQVLSSLQVEVAQRKQVEMECLETEERFQIAFRTSPDAVNLNLMDGTYVDANEAFSEITGWSKEEVLGRTAHDLGIWAAPEDRFKLMAILREHGKVRNLETQFRYKDGTIHAGLLSARTVTIGGTPHILSISRDIHDQVKAAQDKAKLEEQIVKAQRMEAVGRLAGGIAHDFNNLLTAIQGNSSLALLDMEPDNPISKYLEDIDRAAQRAGQLTHQLLAFSKKQTVDLRSLNLNQVVLGVESMLTRVLGEAVTLETHLQSALGAVLADEGQIEQVLVNLAINGRDAMPDGGTLIVGTRVEDVQAGDSPSDPRASGPHIVLSVADTGSGMDQKVRDQIFDPFFTTKQQGTGLGLASCHGIVEKHRGFFRVDSQPGQGSRFEIFLPRSGEQSRSEKELLEPGLTQGLGTILLVEDEDLVRDFAERILSRAGYQVLVCSSGEDALDKYLEDEREIQLLFSDVVMPGINGKILAERLAAKRPQMKILFASGYAGEVLGSKGVLEAKINLIEKPYTAASLTKRVAELLDLAKA